MRLLLLFAFALVLGSGCASDGDKNWWDEVKKDARGDNMQMRSSGWGNSSSSSNRSQTTDSSK